MASFFRQYLWVGGTVSTCGLAACGGGEEIPADGVWKITVASAIVESGGDPAIDSTCISQDETARTYSETFDYALFYDGEAVRIEVDGQTFAEGTRAGCGLAYQSSVWLEDRPSGRVTWLVEGYTRYRGSAGGCDNEIDEGLDWQGTETIVVVDSEDESVPVGCEYNLDTTGTVVSGG